MAYKKYYELLLLCKHTILFRNSFSSLLLGRLCKQSRFTNRRKARRRDRLEKWKKYSILNYNNTKSEQHSSEYGVACVFLYFSLFFIFVFFCEVFCLTRVDFEDHVTAGEGCWRRKTFHISHLHNATKDPCNSHRRPSWETFCCSAFILCNFFMLDLHLRHIMERGLITSLFSFAHNVASKPLQIHQTCETVQATAKILDHTYTHTRHSQIIPKSDLHIIIFLGKNNEKQKSVEQTFFSVHNK